MQIRRDVKYGSHPRHRMDIYEPLNPDVWLIFLHGGAWRSGDKSEYGPLGRAFAERGFGVAIPNYRLSTELGVRHPSHAEDAMAAIHAVGSKNAVIVGHSAGAHMAAWLSTDPSPEIRAFVGLQGIYDIPDLVDAWPSYRDWFIEAAFGPEECWAAASLTRCPVVSKAPWLLIHASGDELVDSGQSMRWKCALASQGVPVELIDPGDVRHFDVVHNLADPGDSTAEAIATFARATSRPSSRRSRRSRPDNT